MPELVLFRLAPDAAEPRRRKERDVEDRHGRKSQRVDEQRQPVAERTGDGADDHDQQQQRVTDADGAQAGLLDSRPASGGLPERDDRLQDAERPDADDRHHHERLEWGVRALEIRGESQGDAEETDDDDRERQQARGRGPERNKGLPEHEEPVARDQEQDHGDVGQDLGGGPGAAKRRPEQEEEGQRAEGDRQVAMSPVWLAHPAGHRAEGQDRKGHLDGKLQEQEKLRHRGRVAYTTIFQGQHIWSSGGLPDKPPARLRWETRGLLSARSRWDRSGPPPGS